MPMLELRPKKDTVVNLEYYQIQESTRIEQTDRWPLSLLFPGSTAGEEVPLALAYGIDPRSSWFGEDSRHRGIA